MALKFWLGGVKSDKSRALIRHILDEADAHADRQYLVIVPEQFSLATQRELVLNSKNQGILNIDVLSFTRFAHRISDEVGSFESDVTMLDEMGKSLLIGMLANSLKDELTVFGSKLDKPGYTDRLKSAISEFMQYGISVEKTFEMAQGAKSAGRGLLSEKLHDIAILYKAFKDHISSRYTTVEELLDKVSALIPSSTTVRNSEIVFDGFTGFTPVQNKLLGVLMENAINVHVALLLEDCIQGNNADGQIREHELFYLSKSTMNNLGRMADERRILTEDPYNADKYALNNVRDLKCEIVYNDKKTAPKLNNTSVRIFAGQDPEEEIRMCHARIMDLIRSKDYRYKDIAILSGDLESYRHHIERILGQHDIPFFIDRTRPVLLNPFIEYIRSFIDVIADNYSISSVFSYLKSGLCDMSDENVNMLENYCLAVNIRGYKAWHTRFDMHTMAAAADELLILNNLREAVTAKFDGFLASLDPERSVNAGSCFSVREFATALYTLIESDGIEEKLKISAEAFELAGNREKSAEYGKIYAKIMDILDELCDLIPDEMTDIRGFGNLLDAGLDAIRIGVIPGGMDYIQVGDLTRSRIPDVKALFIVGANDGIIPNVSAGNGIINENEKEFLESLDDKLVLAPTAKEDVYTQRLYIYMATEKPSEYLFVSYARVSSSGKSLLPSYLIRKLRSENKDLHIERLSGPPQYYTDEKDAYEALINMLYPCVHTAVSKEESERVMSLLKYFHGNPLYADKLSRTVREMAQVKGKEGDSIGSAIAHAIYGNRIVASITRLENYAKCAYRYFLEYGLSLKDREVFSFEAKDLGNIFHDSMKEYSLMMSENGSNWREMEDEKRHALMNSAVDRVIERYREEKLSASARYAYMENRIRRIMTRSADVVGEQIKRGEFTPKYFETDFDSMASDSLSIRLSDKDMVRLKGRIDRIDTCEKDDGIYVRVIDYKSSTHTMDLAAVYEGRQLQLLVYLKAAMEMEEAGNKNIIPAGVLYYRIDDPLISTSDSLSDEQIKDMIVKKLCLKGLVNRDNNVPEMMDENIATDSSVLSLSLKANGELKKNKQAVSGTDMEILTEYTGKQIRRMCSDILDGNIAIPVPDNKKRFTGSDCGYCPYVTICAEKGKITAPEGRSEDRTASVMTNDDWIQLMKDSNETDD